MKSFPGHNWFLLKSFIIYIKKKTYIYINKVGEKKFLFCRIYYDLHFKIFSYAKGWFHIRTLVTCSLLSLISFFDFDGYQGIPIGNCRKLSISSQSRSNLRGSIIDPEKHAETCSLQSRQIGHRFTVWYKYLLVQKCSQVIINCYTDKKKKQNKLCSFYTFNTPHSNNLYSIYFVSTNSLYFAAARSKNILSFLS